MANAKKGWEWIRGVAFQPQILLLELDFRFIKPSPRDVNVVYLLNDECFLYWEEFTALPSTQKKSIKKLRLAPKVQFVVLISIDQCFVYYWDEFAVLPSTQIKIHPKVTFSAWSTFLCNFYVVAHKTNACHSSFMPSFYNHLGIVA